MRIVEQLIVLNFVIMLAYVTHVPTAQAETGFSNMSSAGFRLVNGGMSSLGGAVASADNTLLTTNMSPYQQDMTSSDYAAVFLSADADLGTAKNYLDSITPIGKLPSEIGIGRLLLYPKDNYETVSGLLANLPSTENQLIIARDIFAYGSYLSHPQAQEKLRDAMKSLATIYFLIADEFLIDALEFRFSDMGLGADAKLDEQIALLGKAHNYYTKILNSFLAGFSPALNRTIYISNYFDESVFSLFNLAVERSAITMREKSARTLSRQISPDPLVEASAKKISAEMLRDTAMGTYLVASAIAAKQQGSFIASGGERLVNSLAALRKQGQLCGENVNPLGYDIRFVPMQDFSKLQTDAATWVAAAQASETALVSASRDFDNDAEKMQTTIMQLAENPGGYKYQLASLTGISIADSSFVAKVTVAGTDLYDCSIDDTAYSTCVTTKTKGILGSKHSQLRDAQLRVDLAILRKQNMLESVESENRRHNETLVLENRYNSSTKDTLKNYLQDLKGARTVTKTKTGKKGEWVTETSFNVKNPALSLNINKEIDLQQAMQDLKIATTNLTDEITMQNMLNNLAEIEIELGLAIQSRNAALADFDNSLQDKANLLFLYNKAVEQVVYQVDMVKEKIPEVRILRMQAAIDLAQDLNAATHYAYLAAKALEYKYLKPLTNIVLPGSKTLNIYDLYKVQTVKDVSDFLGNLNSFDACPWGSMSTTTVRISLSREILGLSDKYLDPSGSLTSAQRIALRKEKLQTFISSRINKVDNSLRFQFSTALNDSYISKFNKYNLKAWFGTPEKCDPVSAKGVAVSFMTSQISGFLEPYINLYQKGHSTYLNSSGQVLEYAPVGEYLNMSSTGNDTSIVTKGSFLPYINMAPDTGTLWDPSFKGRSVAASEWEMHIQDTGYDPIDWSKVTDIILSIDSIGSTLQ